MFCADEEQHVVLCWHKACWFFELHRNAWAFVVAESSRFFGACTQLNLARFVALA